MKRKLPKEAEPYKFKPGQSGNPNGGRAHNPAIRALKNLTLETYREMIELVLTGNLTELKAIADDPKTPALQVGIAVCFMKAIKNGDQDVIDKIASRIVGKIPDKIEIDSKNLNANLNAPIDKAELKAAIAKLESDV